MNKRSLSLLTSGLVALALGGIAWAADQNPGTQPDGTQQNPAANPADGGTASQRDVSKEKDAYFAAIAQCDALKGVAEQQQCVDSVRKQYGQM
ncbi:MAG TPA: hypothetical protein VF460_12015 [Burkholderiales bacterium]